MRAITFFLLVALLPLPATAQNTQTSGNSAEGFENLPVPSWGQAVIDSFSKPIHPIIGGIASGGGLGFGVGYDSPEDARWYREGEAIMTVRRYWTVAGEIGRRSSSKRSQLGVFGAVRDMNRINFFGIGPARVVRRSRVIPSARNDVRHTRLASGDAYREVGRQCLALSAGHRTRGQSQRTVDTRQIPGIGRSRGLFSGTGIRQIPRVCRIHLSRPGSRFGRRYRQLSRRVSGGAGICSRSRQRPSQLSSLGNRSTAAYSRLLSGTAPHAARFPRVDQHWRRCAVLHALHARRQRRVEGVPARTRDARHGRYARDAARLPQLSLPRSGFGADAGGIPHSPSSQHSLDGFRRCGPGRATHVGAVQGSQNVDGFSLSYMRKGKTVGRMDVGFGGDGVQVFWSFGAFKTTETRTGTHNEERQRGLLFVFPQFMCVPL